MATELQKSEAFEFFSAILMNSNAHAIQNNPRLKEYENLISDLEGLKLITVDRQDKTETVLDAGVIFTGVVTGDLYLNYLENLRMGILNGDPLEINDFLHLMKEFIKISITKDAPEEVTMNLVLQICYLTSIGLNKFDEYYNSVKRYENNIN
ncbi:MAG: hypothetical protein QXL01_00275 [Thermoplasmatales archaeon]